ncbi:MAG TPA: transketolase [Bacillota bacterium]|nr:transketolase [Bacillota bacterium]
MNQVANDTVSFLEQKAVDIRKDIINMIHYAGAGHPGGALSAADIITALYFHVMNIDPKNPKDEGRDRFVLSKGHACPALYAALAERGFFGMEHLETLRQNDSILQGHPDMNKTPGIDITTGSLGNGLSIGVGMAMLASILDKEYNVYVLLGDGELQEGSVWEAAMAASHHRLRNLIAIVDYNGLQINGWVNNELRIEPLEEKWKAFGWQVIRIDGHCMKEIIHAFSISKKMCGPTVIIADTIKGKGVSFMENVAEWHGKAPNVEQAKTAVFEILHGGENNVAFNKNGVW